MWRYLRIWLTLTQTIGVLASDAGRDWGVQRQSYMDPVTGVQIWEMTKAGSASDNLQFDPTSVIWP